MAISVVCFDLGGVLLQINHEWLGAVQSAGLTCENAAPGRLTDFPSIDALQADEITYEEFLSRLSDYLGLEGPEQARAVHMAILRDEYPGVWELIRDIHSSGLRTGILSNTSGPHWDHLIGNADFPTFNEVQHPHASHLLGLNKPDLAIFRAFESAVSAEPEEIVFFDDYTPNIVGAREAGWTAVQVDTLGDTAQQMRNALREQGLLSN